ncbi:Aldehyde oxidase GLOX1 [Cocos nucifera]|nr:Aldehyde oxidase GLOX1 [Cocos nucifera]
MEATNIAILLLVSFFSFTAVSRSQTNKGQWKILKRSIGISAMHVALLPNNKVVAFDRTDFGSSNISLPLGKCRNDTDDQAHTYDCTAHAIQFDLATRAVRPLTVLTDTWCSSGALTPNGSLVQTGGFNDGDHAVRYLSPCETCDWLEDKDGLAVRRWYATDHILPDGRVIVIGGRGQFNYEFVPKTSSFDRSVFQLPFLGQTKDAAENNLYPFVHLSTDGNLFIFANTKAILLDHENHRVVRSFPEMPGGIARNYPSSGSSVLLPLRLGQGDSFVVRTEVMVCGGSEPSSYSMAMKGEFVPASKSCGRLTISDESPKWEMDEMPIGRVMGDMILLPTGDVLIVNGASRGTAGWHMGRDPVVHPVLYRTGIGSSRVNRTFEILSPSTIPRLYHSTAHLLPDGRVLIGGSNPNIRYEFTGVLFPTELSLEAFSPPYMGSKRVRVSRPTITAIEPGMYIGYGKRLSIKYEVRKGKEEEKVVVSMVAPSFTTHSFSMNQRMLVLEMGEVRRISGGSYAVDGHAPATAILAPPGYYMVFVVHGGVPSRGKWIHVN